MYAVATSMGADVIVRTSADDARSFYADIGDKHTFPQHAPATVLKADQAWEGTALSGPSALLTGGEVYLYYSAAGGIGLAMASDGLTFTKVAGPVLAPDPTMAWETSAPHAPTVAIFPDGSWHMLYGAGDSIGEATSSDGQTWTRVETNPVLSPSAVVDLDAATLATGVQPPFDEGRVDHPVMSPQTDIDGRLQVRVLYTGYGLVQADGGTSAQPSSAIGLAGRYGTSGPLSRQSAPVYTVSLHEAAPAFFEYSGGSLLYVQQDNPALSATMPYTAVAAAYSPADGSLPPPLPYPSSP
jgi:hypothetical protein